MIVFNCASEDENILLSKAELLERPREYKGHLETELRLVTDKLKIYTTGKEVRNMADVKKKTKKSGTLGKVMHEIKTCDCCCGCVLPLKK